MSEHAIKSTKFKIEFKGRRTCDTREEVEKLKKTLGNKYKGCYKVRYPDCEFYIVLFDED